MVRPQPACAVLVSLLAARAPAVAAPIAPSDGLFDLSKAPPWRQADEWRQARGLPQNTVVALLQTSDGYLWAGTKAGVSRFDGVRFVTFDNRDGTQLLENEVWALAEGADRSVWIGTYGGGVSRLQAGRFTVFTKANGLVDDFVTSLCTDTAGRVWIGTDRGLSAFERGRFTPYTSKEGLADDAVRALHCAPDGRVFIGGMKGGLAVFAEGRLGPVSFAGPAPHSEVRSILLDGREVLWVGSTDGLFRIARGSSTRYTTADGLSSDRVFRLLETADGRLWVTSTGGLDVSTGATPSFAPLGYTTTGIRGAVVAITPDREGGIWLGSIREGMVRLHRGQFVSYTGEDGLAHPYVSTVLEDRHGTLWIGTLGGLNGVSANRRQVYGKDSGLPAGPIVSMLEDGAGHLWVGTEAGLYRSETGTGGVARGGRLRFAAVGSPRPKMHIRVIYQDRRGAIWIGTNLDGLLHYERGSFTTYTTSDGLSSDVIRGIAEDASGTYYIGTREGLDTLKDGRFGSHPSSRLLADQSIESMLMDRESTLWIATRNGVSRLKDGRLTTYRAADGLYSSHVYSFVEDGRGHLWMNSGQGIFYVPKRELEEFAGGSRRSITSVAYGLEHGLGSTIGAAGHSPNSWRSKDGRIWFGMNGGLSVIDSGRLVTPSAPPPVHIEGVTIDGHGYEPGTALTAGPGRGDLGFRYTAPSFRAPEKVRFRYRLDGYDSEWIDAGTSRQAAYTNIPPGPYRFRVIAGNGDDVWNETGAVLDLRLRPHFYQTAPFAIFCVALGGLAGLSLHRLRVRRLRVRERDLTARVKDAIAQIRFLRGLLPICASCKKIRDDKGYWNNLESYIHAHSEAEFSHSICPDCMARLYPDFAPRRGE